jgi:hypothetical protein
VPHLEIPTSGKLNECENISNRPSLEGDFFAILTVPTDAHSIANWLIDRLFRMIQPNFVLIALSKA